jgi:NAD(P)-dependent dehydrogenase (short-subunit alcohol dehydrogenase family)
LPPSGLVAVVVPTDVSDEAAVQALAAASVDRFGAVHLLCNNAGVVSTADAWFGPVTSWSWVLGVSLWGVIHGIRAFLPTLAALTESDIVNTASIAGLLPGLDPRYDATKHAVVAISEDLYRAMRLATLLVGVSVLCPGWVSTSVLDADRNWPASLGEAPPPAFTTEVTLPHLRRVIDEGMAPADVADLVADAVATGRFWIFTSQEFVDIVARRWQNVAAGRNPDLDLEVPGLPPSSELAAQIQHLLAALSAGS